MPDSTKNLLKRTDDQILASDERCVAADKSIAHSTEIIRLSRESILYSRRQIARLCDHCDDDRQWPLRQKRLPSVVSRTASPVPQREYHGDGYSVAASFAPIDPG